jgi:hypothetical protein
MASASRNPGRREQEGWCLPASLDILELWNQQSPTRRREPSPAGEYMERYIGMDVHAASCTLAVISEKGRKLKDFPVETNGRFV